VKERGVLGGQSPPDAPRPLSGQCEVIKPMKHTKWLYCTSYLYLGLPFVIFCIGWLRTPINIVVGLIICWIILRQLQRTIRQEEKQFVVQPRQIVIAVIILGIWVLFSGIGGWTFQNIDFHIRNAIYRDLINYPWPVIYSPQQSNFINPGSTQIMLVYYIGYWLPGALVGKLAGWGAANAFLFLWIWLGVSLIVMLLANWLKKPPILLAIILIFFSGMDLLGALLVYPRSSVINFIWPPFQYLERWPGGPEYESFTTHLYWAFNQAIPACLCTALLVTGVDRKDIFFLWTLCFFFAPLPALGMIPFVLIEVFSGHASTPSNETGNAPTREPWGTIIRGFRDQIVTLITPDNLLGGGSVLAISYLYFSANLAAHHSTFLNYSPAFLLIFFALEGGFLWFLLLPLYRKKLRWYILGGFLLLLPVVQVGSEWDFTMRASIPALFLLMVGTIQGLFCVRGIRRLLILICLVIGAVTPLYEINRSVYFTAKYYLSPEDNPVPVLDPTISLERQPYILVADNYKSISNCRLCLNFVGDGKSSLFDKYLANHQELHITGENP
jgi:hypothetical protein